MIKKKGFGSLSVFDIDDTLFHTTAKIAVIKDGKTLKELTNREFNTYVLNQGEAFDFSQFGDSNKFYHESEPIDKMIDNVNEVLKKAESNPDSKVVIVTARADFNDKEKFLDTFRKHGLDIDRIRVERAGNITDIKDVAFKKVIIIRNYINTNMYDKVRLFDDSMSNLKAFLTLKQEFPTITFEAYYAKADGSIKVIE